LDDTPQPTNTLASSEYTTALASVSKYGEEELTKETALLAETTTAADPGAAEALNASTTHTPAPYATFDAPKELERPVHKVDNIKK
jgi:hypothetical protein